MKIIKYLVLLLLVLWSLFFGFLILQNGDETHSAGIAVTELLRHIFHLRADTWTVHNALRISAHIVGFAILGFLLVLVLFLLLQIPVKKAVVWSFCVCAFLAVASEAIKYAVPGRHFEWIDVARNGVGMLIGTGLGFLVSLTLSVKR